MSQILITGVNGFVGRNIARALLRTDNTIWGTSQGAQSSVIDSAHYISASLGEGGFVEQLLSSCSNLDVIIHNAASLSHDDADRGLIDVNCSGIMQMCELARKTNCKKIIYISSIPVIGTPLFLPITEEHPVNPPTLYHSTKVFGEYAFNLLTKLGVTVINLRLPSPIGADMPQNKIFSVFVEKCLKGENITLLGKGGRVQNYIDVDDIAIAVQKSIDCVQSGTFNIAHPRSLSNLELAEICKKLIPSATEITLNGLIDADENVKWIVSTQKAHKILGFVASSTIEESISKRIRYYENHISQ